MANRRETAASVSALAARGAIANSCHAALGRRFLCQPTPQPACGRPNPGTACAGLAGPLAYMPLDGAIPANRLHLKARRDRPPRGGAHARWRGLTTPTTRRASSRRPGPTLLGSDRPGGRWPPSAPSDCSMGGGDRRGRRGRASAGRHRVHRREPRRDLEPRRPRVARAEHLAGRRAEVHFQRGP